MQPDRGRILLTVARNAIAASLGEAVRSCTRPPWLEDPGASFVTLTQDDRLRGCIGSLEPRQALRLDVEENARAAAFRDPRFAPVTRQEYTDIDIEVSVLSPMEAIHCEDECTARSLLRPGVDGVVFEYGHRRSTFLPQVWEQLPEPAQFLAYLKEKAGLPAGFWDPQVRLSRYTVSKWRDRDLHADAN